MNYLQVISEINKDRNLKILKQINFLSELFIQNGIKYVFLKGAAILLFKPYDAISERMIGDIDILISEEHIVEVENLLIKEGFNKQKYNKTLFSEKYIKKRHLNRLISKDFIAAIELHQLLLDKENSHLLKPDDILDNRKKIEDKHYVCSKYHLWKHTILNWQYNDFGFLHNKINFRSIYDVINLDFDLVRQNSKNEIKEVIHFYCLSSVFFKNKFVGYNFSKFLFQIQISSLQFDKFLRLLSNFKYSISIIFSRARLMLIKRDYRKTIISNPLEVFKKFFNLIFKK